MVRSLTEKLKGKHINKILKSVDNFVDAQLATYQVAKGCGNKVIHDPIWGSILLNEWEVQLLDSPLVQRLKNISQLGMVDLVYPTANHKRFDHTLGVLYVSDMIIKRVLENEKSLKKDAQDTIYKIRVAALLHDIGHTCFSHATENAIGNLQDYKIFFEKNPLFTEANPHELMAYLIINSVSFKKFFLGLDFPSDWNIGDPNIFFSDIGNMIIGMPPNKVVDGKKSYIDYFKTQVINGQFDADKIDYLHRDSFFTGVNVSFDIERFLNKMKVIESNPDESGCVKRDLAFDYKSADVFEQLIFGKLLMTSRVYRHQKVLVAENIFGSIVVELFERKKLENMSDLLQLNDANFREFLSKNKVADLLSRFDAILQRKLPKRAFIININALKDRDFKKFKFFLEMKDDRSKFLAFEKALVFQSKMISSVIGRSSDICAEDIRIIIPPSRTVSKEPTQTPVYTENGEPAILNDVSPLEEWIEALSHTKWCNYIFANENDRDIVYIASRNILKANGFEFDEKIIKSNVKKYSIIEATERKFEENLSLLYTESKTGLRNESYLKKIFPLYQELLSEGEILCMCYMDMNNLKHLNDAFEHDGGDLAINAIANYLRTLESGRCTVARVNNAGDEFVILNLAVSKVEMQKWVEKITIDLKPIEIQGEHINLQVSVGAVCCNKGNKSTYETVSKRADNLMAEAKKETSMIQRTLNGKEYEMKSESRYKIN